jgi:hypothetical protein
MSLPFRSSRALVLPLLLVLFGTSTVPAQNANQVPKSRLTGKATILAMNPNGIIQVKMENGEQWLIKVPDDPRKTVVTGSAATNWLSPGMFVKFTATFDEKGAGQQTINEMQVFIPSKEDPLGAYRAAGGNAGNLFDNEKPAGTRKKPQKVTARFDIAGQLRGLRDGVIYVNAGGAALRVPLAEKCSIRVVINGFQFGRIGDSVTLDAWYYTPQKELGRAIANRLDIVAAKPFERVKYERKRPSPRDKEKPGEKPGEKPAEEKPAGEKPSG